MDESIDLKEFFRLLFRKIWIVILCAAILGTSVYVYTLNFVTPQYQASVSMYVNNNSEKDNSHISSADLAVALRLVETYVNIIHSDAVLDKVIEKTGLMLTTAKVRGMISAEVIGETEMFRVTVTTPNAQLSADLANAIAKVAPSEIAAIIEGSFAKVVDYAKVPKTQSSPNYTLSAILGAAVGAVLVVFVLLVQMMTDTRVKGEEDLVNICPVPVLGAIPRLSTEVKSAGKKK